MVMQNQQNPMQGGGAPKTPLQGGVMPPMPGAPTPPMGEGQGEPISPEQQAELDAGFEELNRKSSDLESKKIISKNKVRQKKLETLKKVFDMMEEQGVDPNNLESIQKFLSELEESDPDLVSLFEEALMGLSPEMGVDMGAMEDDALPQEDIDLPPGLPGMTPDGEDPNANFSGSEDIGPPPSPGLGEEAVPGAGAGAEGLTNKYRGVRDQVLRK